MAEFDVPNIGFARQALKKLADNPSVLHGMGEYKKKIIRELYPEIREARLAGHSWQKIAAAIKDSGVRPTISQNFIAVVFREIDNWYEKETGVKALPKECPRGMAVKERAKNGKAVQI